MLSPSVKGRLQKSFHEPSMKSDRRDLDILEENDEIHTNNLNMAD